MDIGNYHQYTAYTACTPKAQGQDRDSAYAACIHPTDRLEFLTDWTNPSTAALAVKGIVRCKQAQFADFADVHANRVSVFLPMSIEGEEKRPETRIQREKREIILEAALEIFSIHGFRGSTIDQIAEAAGMSKPNLLYYHRSKEDIYAALLHRLLDTWLAPLMEMDAGGDPLKELRRYIRRKIEMARDYPRESRLFANEILRGAPHIMGVLTDELKPLVDEKAAVLRRWMRECKIASVDPYHLIFALWAVTQHYADFDAQVQAVLGPDRGGKGRFEDAARFIERLFLDGLRPR